MLAIIIFIVASLLLAGVFRHRFRRACRYRGGGPWRRGRFSRLYGMFEALDTSPGQEKAIRSALKDMKLGLSELRPDVQAARARVASELAGDGFDAPALEESLDEHLSGLLRANRVVTEALGKIHEALDAEQRRRLARFIESMPFGAPL